MTNDFSILLKAVLDSSGIGKSDIDKVQKVLNKHVLNFATDIDKATLLKTVKEIVPEVEAELKKISGIDIKISDDALLKAINQVYKDSANTAKQVEKERQAAIKESAKLVDQLAKSYKNIQTLEIKKGNLDTSKDANEIAELNKQIEQATTDFNSLLESMSKNSNFDSSAWDKAKSAIDAATKSQVEYINAQKQDSLNSAKNTQISTLETLKAKWEEQGVLVGEFKDKVEQLATSISSVGNENELNSLKIQLEALKTEASQIAEVNKILFSMDNGYGSSEYQNQINKIIASLNQYGADAQKIKTITEDLQSTFDSMKGLSGQELIDQATSLEKKFDAAKISIDEAKQAYDKFMQPVSGEKVTSLILKIQNFLSKNSKITKDAREKLEAYVDELGGGNISLEKWNQINTVLKETETSMRGLNRLGKAFKDQWTQAVSSFSTWLSASAVVMKGISQIKSAISELKEINTLLTEISKADNSLSKSELSQIGNDAFEVASKYGKTATDYLSGVQEMSRAGYTNATSMAELSVAAQGAGDMTAELANQYIIATDVAFKMNGSIEALTETLDGANNITNNNAVNMTELAEGMSVVGSQAASSQMKVNEITAAIGTMVAVTQKSGSEMGNAFKGILMNLQQVSGDVGDGEDIIDSDSLTKYEAACAELGVSLKEVRNGVVSLKEPMQILKELSEAYVQLEESDAKRANLLSAVGGKYRANALNVILENYDLYEKMLQDYTAGIGSMAIEAEKTANSWEGSMYRLSNTWTDTIGHIANSDAIITIINSLNGVLSVINSITDSLGSLQSIGLGVGLAAGIKNVGKLEKLSFIFVLNMPTIICVL